MLSPTVAAVYENRAVSRMHAFPGQPSAMVPKEEVEDGNNVLRCSDPLRVFLPLPHSFTP